MKLTGPKRDAKSGTARSLVVFLHGYGADGNDLIGLGDALAPHLPDTDFLSPNAPEPCRASPMGRQWFPIPWMDGSSELEMRSSFRRSVEAAQTFISDEMAARGLDEARTALVGFSQGTMMSLHAGTRRTTPLAGIVGFSGRYVPPEENDPILTKPPVLLVHGDADPVLPVQELHAAREALAAEGFAVRWHVSAGLGHGIGPDGLTLALDFLKTRLAASG